MSWTLEQWLGLHKLVDDWDEPWPWWGSTNLGGRKGYGLFKDGVGHLLIGLFVGFLSVIPTFTGSMWRPMLAALVIGAARELWQFARDSSPNPNLVDRCKDVLEVGLGGLLLGLVL